ncbi:exoribonuclease-2 [Desulfobaculum xiamenense]|uniref:Exoribonuclease-2 n=1 Tax=Desulfobaculum xiamenense TaxID=995050 RepID=A0A846QRM2_9BACT|nr:ribonuclease catalytic domain-containing protein [Desulfobaculum xiamenense]NJB69162.1 exoribonuclease-2 [Desulfobaculum xiamenense]
MSSPIVRYPAPGCIVEFMQANRPLLAWVLEEQSGRYRLLTINSRETKLPAARLLPWSGPAYDAAQTREAIMDKLRQHHERRDALMTEVDPAAIWDFAQGELDHASTEWFAGLVWDTPDIDQIAAMGRMLLDHKSHFKFSPPDFEIYPEETVQKRLAEEAARKERELVVAEGQSFFHALWDARTKGTKAPKQPDADMAARLRDVLFAAMADTSGSSELTIWNAVRKGLPEDPFLPLFLAQTWGIVPEHFNQLLLQEGYDWGDGWSAAYDAEIDALGEALAAQAREPEDVPFVSIDSATTRDIDDAFHVRRLADGTLRLQIALACPSLTWEFDSPLDRAVRDRASSLYLPEGTSHMLPERYGLGMYSLAAGEPRPALVVDCLLSPEGRLVRATPRHAWVRLAENTTYETVETALEAGTADENITLAAELGERLRDLRIADGAVIVDRPDPDIALEGEGAATKVTISQRPETPRAQLLVSEFMILANSALGNWAREKGIPLLYRTQDITLPGDAAGVWSTPEDSYRVVRLMAPTYLELVPKRHATLAVTAYSPITSPLRRYPDLLNMAQVLSYLLDGEPCLDADRITRMMPLINARNEAAARIQRYRPRYWKLVYFSQHKHDYFSAVAVDDGPLVSVALPEQQLYLRAPQKMFGEKIYPGQRFAVRLNKINPLLNEIRIVEALEE